MWLVPSIKVSLVFSLMLGAGGLVSCINSDGRNQQLSALSFTDEQKKQLEQAQLEMDIGRNMAGRILRLYGVYGDEALSQYVNEVGTYVGKSSDFPERRYMFEIYKSDTVNAFACPGGYILISSAAIKLAKNEAELAHILAHEIAHVGRQHMLNTLQKMNQEDLDKASSDEGAEHAEHPETVLIRKRPEPEESAMGNTLARYLTGGSTGLNLIKAAKAGMSIILEKGLGADLEFDADREGTRYAVNAGYQPKALVNYLCRLETSRGRPKNYCQTGGAIAAEGPKTVLDKTHPKVPDRVREIQSVLDKMQASSIVGAKGRKRFQQAKKGMRDASGPESPEAG
jgi:predicted Zn-dependent protease